mmetsp:Transcript_8641/g.18986  ORF Transcript_8641/g.18986 Transcript_8641/m.18986 type:complete len:268 (+) Transcript_8641:114-917(+)
MFLFSRKALRPRRFAALSSVGQTDKGTTVDFMSVVAEAARKASPALIEGLSSKGWVCLDNFLGPEWSPALRAEAVHYYNSGYFSVSQSSRYDAATGGVHLYDKQNVFAMQLEGGDSYYEGPLLHEYIVSLTQTLAPILSEAFPEAHLNAQYASNKLAVCTGSGSAYEKHYDNSGGDDVRKLTVLYYLNQWRPDMGGQFRIFGEQGTVDVEPVADRLLVFWSDVLVHSVLPSEAKDAAEHRYALTLWLTCDGPQYIEKDSAQVKRHFD